MNEQLSRLPPAAATLLTTTLRKPLERFFAIEAASGILLLGATLIALLWANSPWSESYAAVWDVPVRLGIGGSAWDVSLHFVVNDGLMTLFFLVVGLEIRRELHDGSLADLRNAVVPLAAALGGIVAPAAIYFAFTADTELQQGWAVPTATDIAFAIGVLTLLGKRVPPPVRMLLLSLAIIDDVAAILIIAFFYSSGIQVSGLLIAAGGVVGVILFQRLDIRPALAYVLPGAVVWGGLLGAGIHPTLAGVILGLLTPTAVAGSRERVFAGVSRALDDLRDRLSRGRHHTHELAAPMKRLRHADRELVPPVTRVELALHPWVAYGIMPLFALANAGVVLGGLHFDTSTTTTLTAAIVCGLVLGKPLGILTFTWVATRLGLGTLSPEVGWRGVLLVSCLGGIGFTMALFIATLAFDDPALLAPAKFAVLVASGVAGVGGLLLGRYVLFKGRPPA